MLLQSKTVNRAIPNSEKWFVVVNPTSGSKRGLEDWPYISKLLRDNHIIHEYAFTERKYHAIELTVEAVVAGFRKIIIVGGDGTIHEVVNGLFVQQQIDPREVLLAVIGVGTGNDWMRMFGVPRKYSEAVRAIVEGNYFLQDVGRITYHEAAYRQSRYFVNGAGVGFDAFTIKTYHQMLGRWRRGKGLYIRSIAKALLRFKATGMRVWVDGQEVVNDLVFSAAIGIGKYAGGGLMQVPEAIADDGLFDITVIRRMGILRILYSFRALFNGKILELPRVSNFRGRSVRFTSSPEVWLEADGELLGETPVEFEIIDRAIRVIVGRNIHQNRDEAPICPIQEQ
jgi:YegS/Rv2252/BmrU family lipid kinase